MTDDPDEICVSCEKRKACTKQYRMYTERLGWYCLFKKVQI